MDGIWIRSQNMEVIVFCKAVSVEANKTARVSGHNSGIYGFLIGQYNTKERAIQVMDDIQKHIYNGVHQVYQMPKE